MNSKIPVLLLTGYLGSGKTTLLNRILSNQKGIRFAVIVNDIGEVNIDADLIQQGGIVGRNDDSLVALQNGCICCTLKMDLVDQLRDIASMHKFDYIVIEASGICEPAPIAQTICSIPAMFPDYIKDTEIDLDCIVTVVDALRMQSEFACGNSLVAEDIDEEDIENLIIQQVEFCNKILLNKASEVSAEELGRIKSIIRTLQPNAEIVECDYCDVELETLINTNLFDFDKVASSAAWIEAIEGPSDDHDDNDHHEGHHNDDSDDENDDAHDHDAHEHGEEGHHHHHHHHHEGGEVEEYGIGTFVYCRRRPMDINKFDNFVAKYWPKGVIRAKGICYFEDEPDVCYLFEQAGKQVSIKNAGQWYATMPQWKISEMMEKDAALRRDWDPEYGDRMQKLVFIGQNLDKDFLTEALDMCLV